MIATVLAAVLVTRSIVPAANGPNRLDPDVDLLSRAAPGFADLRLHDASGNEVPYLVIAPPTEQPQWRSASSMLPIQATKFASGFDADLGTPQTIDRIRFDGIPPPFLKRLRVEASGDREHWSVVAADATIFDLPEQKLRNTAVDIAPGAYRYVRITWDDRASARVTRVDNLVARLVGPATPPPRVSVPMRFRRVASETGKSRYQLTLPAARLPVTDIELQVANGDVFRDATVIEPRLSGSTIAPVTLGTATLRRATRDGSVAADLSIPIGTPDSADLELVVDDGSNPPLPITSIDARFAPLPWIYFDSDGSTLSATYGDPNLAAPRYDLEASRRFATTAATQRARWSGPAPAPRASAVEASVLPLSGASIDAKRFRFSRPIPGEPRGLTSLLLDLDVLAHSNSLDDVRIVDSHNTQVPYLVERRDAPLTVALPVPKAASSHYRFALPYDSLPSGTRIVFTTNARVFQRNVSLRSDAQTLDAQPWGSSDPNAAPPPLTFTPPLRGVSAIELTIDDGDNAPIALTSAQLLVPQAALRFYGTGSKLTLLYGGDVGAPRYDLALLAPRLFGERANEITLQAEAAPHNETRFETKLFWIAIAIAAAALLAVLARLLTNVSA